MWQDIRSGIRRFTVLAAGVLLAMACLAGNAKTYAQTAVDDSVLLDPFDPVPQIGFHHGEYGDCYDPCGNRHCYRDCGYHRHAGCEHDCRRPCERDCESHDALDRYNRQADMWAVLANIYMDEMNWYEEHYRGGAHHYSLRDDDHHDGDDRHDAHDGDRHDGTHDGHDGDRHDAHDGDHHDGDHDGHDGDHRDGGDGHDGDHHSDHDGDHHADTDHHDGQWQDDDGIWHDGPPPNGYGH